MAIYARLGAVMRRFMNLCALSGSYARETEFMRM